MRDVYIHIQNIYNKVSRAKCAAKTPVLKQWSADIFGLNWQTIFRIDTYVSLGRPV